MSNNVFNSLITKITFLPTIVSKLICSINPVAYHNYEKFMAIYKVHYLTLFDGIEGDYLEFGVYKGSSFIHSINSFKKNKKILRSRIERSFYGFDSFEGFGNIKEIDSHPFYRDLNFVTDFKKIEKRINKSSKNINSKIIKGFFNKTLSVRPVKYGIKKAAIIFSDADVYSASKDIFNFISEITDIGTYFVLDDFFSFKGSLNKGSYKAFQEFLKKKGISVRKVFDYGMGGSVYVRSK